jgi:hypothetical protein
MSSAGLEYEHNGAGEGQQKFKTTGSRLRTDYKENAHMLLAYDFFSVCFTYQRYMKSNWKYEYINADVIKCRVWNFVNQ